MKPGQEIIEQILCRYGIRTRDIQREVLLDIDQSIAGKHIVKHYEKITADESRYVLKLLRLPMCRVSELEKQRIFAEKFRSLGFPTPKHCVVSRKETSERGRYLLPLEIAGEDFLAGLEGYAGGMISCENKNLPEYLGELLGRMHGIAESVRLSYGEGFFKREFEKGKTDYLSLWGPCGTDFLPSELLHSVVGRYEELLHEMKKWMELLPAYAVQGDLYYMNLAENRGKIQVIDFERLGDEVLSADFIITWCRFWYRSEIFRGEEMDTSRRIMVQKIKWKIFMDAYSRHRRFSAQERQALPVLFGVLGSVYGTKALVNTALRGDRRKAAKGLWDVNMVLYHPEYILE